MTVRHLYILLLLIAVGCQQMQAAEKSPLNDQKQSIAPKQLDKQLKINRDALLQGPTEQMRIDAATIILFDDSSNARQILLDALNQTENAEARAAVCKALKQSREENRHNSINNKEDFVLPLLTIIRDQNAGAANLAAEATVIFDYWQISQPLEQMISDDSLPVDARLNAIYALKLQKDIKAITKLINLLDDPDQQIAQAAEKAVKDAGIPVVKDTAARQQLIEELNNKGKEEFLRDWLIRQEAEMNRLQAETQQWRQMYLSSLDKIYSGINEDNARVKFLSEHLNGQQPVVKLWALENISKWRVGTSSKLPTELGPLLMNLISDEDRTVRLRTARLLSLMGQLSSAEKLLAQVKSEKDEEVGMAMFMALGAACQFAFAPDSGVNISPSIREQTLELASEYLFETEPIEVQNGAEVIKKLLKQNGLPVDLTENYLVQISQKYEDETSSNGDQVLRAALLSTMAELCAQGSPIASSAREKYGQWFEESLADESDSVRDAAISGLINIDKTSALRKLREDHVNDPSAQIRRKVIDLAREVGSEADLGWLEEKLKNSEENQLAWPAMMAIFGRSNVDLLVDWLERIEQENSGLTNQQLISFFEMVGQKIQAENMPQIAIEINEKLAVLYTETGNYELATEYWGLLHQSAQSGKEQHKYMNQLLGVYLATQNVKNAVDLIHNYLLDKDLDSNDLMIETLNSFISTPPEGTDPNSLLVELEKLDIPQARPKWTAQKEYWLQMFLVTNEPNAPEGTGS
ncbi:MAG: HEAT repeat domain-containing protein [Planctomycetota bacterium]